MLGYYRPSLRDWRVESRPVLAPPMARRDYVILASIAAVTSVAAFLYYFKHDELLLYGDAVAHINIARRVFDSQRPGFSQLGTVWLPLPHVLMLPLVAWDWAWRTGAGAALISMAAYVFGALGIFRLVRARVGRKTAWLAAFAYLANPNLIYLQTTAMTELLYLALFIWAVVFLSEFLQANQTNDVPAARRALRGCLLTTLGLMLTRYDGWFAAAVFALILMIHVTRRRSQPLAVSFRGVIRSFLLPLALVPILWLAYNRMYFGDALAFARGPYSAKAISARTTASTGFTHPGGGSLHVAGLYFLKAAQANVVEGPWGVLWLLFAGVAAVQCFFKVPSLRILLLLWLPLPFYAVSIAYAGVPIFVPEWWPFSYYNTRYGLQLLPALIVFGVVFFAVGAQRWGASPMRFMVMLLAPAMLAASYASIWKATPIALREARANSAARIALQQKLSDVLAKLPSSSTILMYTGDHVGALQRSGIHLKRTVNETILHTWERALTAPAESADYVVAIEGDPVWKAVEARPAGLQELARISSPKQPAAVIYKASSSRE